MAAPALPGVERVWSPYQQAIYAAIENDSLRHIVVEALAGSGKSTSLEESVRRTYREDRAAVFAFNKIIADAMKPRVGGIATVATINSFGNSAIARACGRKQIDARAMDPLIKRILGDAYGSFEARKACAKIVSLAKGCLIAPADLYGLDALADAYGVDMSIAARKGYRRERIIGAASSVLRCAADSSRDVIDFDDQIWLPLVTEMAVPSYDWVFVDETQDLNAAQLELMMRAGAAGRICAVGDRRQAIYGFRGADRHAIPRIIERLGATVLPLSISYRCPRAVVAEAQALVPAIEAAPGAPEGSVTSCDEDELRQLAEPGDFVVSRTNAPLLSLAWRWLAEGRPAEIRGRDIGGGLASWIKGTNATTMAELTRCIDSWRDAEVARLAAAERDTEHVHDKADCLHALAEGCGTTDDMLGKIDRIFSRDDDGAPRRKILLTSTHRAKGLEAERVWLLRDTYLKRNSEEEKNLLYVGITRAKRELIYVHSEAA